MLKKDVAIYCRVDNKSEFEIERQKEVLKKHCESNGYEIFKIYEDNGYNSNSLNRPALSQMLRDLNYYKFQKIITLSVDRICRTSEQLQEFIFLIINKDCVLETLTDTLPISSKVKMADGLGKLYPKIQGRYI